MRIQDHIAKLSWTAADKIVYILYGIITIIQISFLSPYEYGLYTLLSTIHSYILLISEGFALQSIIKFGSEYNTNIVNRFSLIWHVIITLGLSIIVFLSQDIFTHLLNEPRYATIAWFLPIYSLATIPRVFCLKILLRDIRLKEWFLVNLLWMGTMAITTILYIITHQLDTFEDMLVISFVGVSMSSVGAIWLARKQLHFKKEGKLTLQKFIRFGYYQANFNALNSLIKQLDVVIIGVFFSIHIVGIYGSAKNLFRVFDQAFEGIIALLFPGAVRLIAQGRITELRTFISKATSFSLLAMFALVLLIYSGVAEFFITSFLPATYVQKAASAVDYFKLLSLAALAMPFSVLYTLMMAYDKVKLLVLYALIASISGFTVLYLVGFFQLPILVPLGFVSYYFILGVLCYRFVHKQLGLSPRMLLRAVPDTIQFARQVWQKRQKQD